MALGLDLRLGRPYVYINEAERLESIALNRKQFCFFPFADDYFKNITPFGVAPFGAWKEIL